MVRGRTVKKSKFAGETEIDGDEQESSEVLSQGFSLLKSYRCPGLS